MSEEVDHITKFKELKENEKKLKKKIEVIEHRLNNEDIDSRVKNVVKLTLEREVLMKKWEENHELLIQTAEHIQPYPIMEDINVDDDENMSNASDDNTSQEDTSEISNDCNASSATAVSEQESYQSPMDDYEQNHGDTLEEMSEKPQFSPKTSIAGSSKALVSRRSPEKKPSLLRQPQRAASKRATEAIQKLFKDLFQRNLKTEGDEDWRQGQFAWIKFTERSKCLPGFVFPAMYGIRKAKTITLKGVISLYKFVIYRSYPRNDDKLPDPRYVRALELFNSDKDCKYK